MSLVTYGPCYICERECDETSVRVDIGATVETVCAICWEKADEGDEDA